MSEQDYSFRNGSILTTRNRLRKLAVTPAPVKLYAASTRGERIGWTGLAVAAVALCASISFAVIATMPTAPQPGAVVNLERASLPAASVPAARLPSARVSVPMATDPLRWEDLTLMLRTGLRDEEIVAAAAGKQLVLFIDPAREEILRSLGAGNRLLDYLRTRPVYAAPAMTQIEHVAVAPRLVATAMPAKQPVYQPAPTPDYAARDRQIQSLKTQIDALDEQVRCVRTNPKDSRYWHHYYGPFNGIDQQKLDAYLNDLDRQRDDLRRQKWGLEGR